MEETRLDRHVRGIDLPVLAAADQPRRQLLRLPRDRSDPGPGGGRGLRARHGGNVVLLPLAQRADTGDHELSASAREFNVETRLTPRSQ